MLAGCRPTPVAAMAFATDHQLGQQVEVFSVRIAGLLLPRGCHLLCLDPVPKRLADNGGCTQLERLSTDPVRVLVVADHVVLGSDRLIKFWDLTPEMPRRSYQSWHAYELPNMAAGYLVHNLLMHLSPDAEKHDGPVWFPERSKEVRRTHVLGLRES